MNDDTNDFARMLNILESSPHKQIISPDGRSIFFVEDGQLFDAWSAKNLNLLSRDEVDEFKREVVINTNA